MLGNRIRSLPSSERVDGGVWVSRHETQIWGRLWEREGR